jgi:glucokinase
MVIAGDIGGTKTDLAIFSNEAGPHTPLAQVRVHSADYPSLEAIAKEFLSTAKHPVDRACFAVAGPVIEGRVKTTNLPWLIEEAALAEGLNFNRKRVLLINDLEAIAQAIPILRPSDVQTLNTGSPVAKGSIAVIAPGTGLGESFLTWEGARYVAHSSEGGHSDFAPTDERQVRLLEYLFRKFEHVSFEHVCSGIGIPNIYDYLRDVERLPEKPEVAARLALPGATSAVIIDEAMNAAHPSELCTATMETFLSILASEASNLAIKVLATGGVYLAGGVVTHALSAFQSPAFMKSFTRKGRFTDLMSRIPIHLVVSRAGLAGAAVCGLAKQD